MPAPRKYPDELRERATRMVVDARRDPASRSGAIARIADQLGINRETLRNWVTQAEVDAGDRPGTTTDQAQRLVELERENHELRRANAILKSASAFFVSTRMRTVPAGLARFFAASHCDGLSAMCRPAGPCFGVRGRGLIGACLLNLPD